MLSDNSTPTSDVISNGHASPLSDLATGEKCEPEAAKEPEAEQLEAERKVQSSLDIEGKVEVVTSVKVQSSSGSDGEGEGEGERQPAESQGEKLRRESAEVAIAEVKTALTVTMVRDNTVEVPDSETDSDGMSVCTHFLALSPFRNVHTLSLSHTHTHTHTLQMIAMGMKKPQQFPLLSKTRPRNPQKKVNPQRRRRKRTHPVVPRSQRHPQHL